MTTEPTDAELKAMWQLHAADIGGIFCYARAVLAKWGNQAQAGEPVGCIEIEGSLGGVSVTVSAAPAAFLLSPGMHKLFTAPQPVALELLTDWDMRGQLAASLHCWHRLTPNEAAELVAFVQRVSAQGIKGGQHGTDSHP